MDKVNILHLVEKLNSLLEGDRAAAALAACGPAAIEPLKRFLLEGRPNILYQPRRRAVETLSQLQARNALLEYLQFDRPIDDEQVRLSEEVVQNAAAGALSQWPELEIAEALTDILQQRCLSGAVESLGKLKHSPAIPLIIATLEDDVCREAAETALKNMGQTAIPELILTVLSPRPDRDQESASSMLRRGSAARLLADLGVSEEQWNRLRGLVDERIPEILIAFCRMAGVAGDKEILQIVSGKLIGLLDRADWYTRNTIGDLLVEIYDTAGPLIKREIAKRDSLYFETLVFDPALSMLLQVKWRAGVGAKG
jgi:hypothetical protein